jgi:hypothetical protein
MFGVLANADGVHRHSKPAHTHALGFAQKVERQRRLPISAQGYQPLG